MTVTSPKQALLMKKPQPSVVNPSIGTIARTAEPLTSSPIPVQAKIVPLVLLMTAHASHVLQVAQTQRAVIHAHVIAHLAQVRLVLQITNGHVQTSMPRLCQLSFCEEIK